FFSSRRRHTRWPRDWSSDVCSSDLDLLLVLFYILCNGLYFLQEVKTIAKDIKENEQKISYHGKRADTIVKGMLQHSRTSSSQKEIGRASCRKRVKNNKTERDRQRQ